MSGARKDRSLAFDDEALDHLGALRKLSRRLAQNQTEADDLVQEAYLHAFRASDRFTPGTNLSAWLRTILSNLAKNRRRDRGRSRVETNEQALAWAADSRGSEQASPEQLLLSEVVGPRLQTALESMPKALRDAVWLRDVEELSYADIASQLRVPIGTVMSRIAQAQRSPAAAAKAQDKYTADGWPVHSFRTLLADLRTIAKNTVALGTTRLDITTTPTAFQQRIFDLLNVRFR